RACDCGQFQLRLNYELRQSGRGLAPAQGIQIDRFEFLALDAGANLFGRPALLRFLERVGAFFRAGGTDGAVGAREATVQAGMAEGTVAAAITGKLIEDAGNLGGLVVDLNLPLLAEEGSGELRAGEDGRQRLSFGGRLAVEGRDVRLGIGPLCMDRVAGHDADR